MSKELNMASTGIHFTVEWNCASEFHRNQWPINQSFGKYWATAYLAVLALPLAKKITEGLINDILSFFKWLIGIGGREENMVFQPESNPLHIPIFTQGRVTTSPQTVYHLWAPRALCKLLPFLSEFPPNNFYS